MTTRRFSIKQLKPETFYELRVRANNAAGSSEYTYSFETIPSSLRHNGERLGSGSGLGGPGGSGGLGTGADGEDGTVILIPVVIGILVVIVCVGGGVVYVRKSNEIRFSFCFIRTSFRLFCLIPEAMSRKGVYLQSEEHLTSSSHGQDSLLSKLPPPNYSGHQQQQPHTYSPPQQQQQQHGGVGVDLMTTANSAQLPTAEAIYASPGPPMPQQHNMMVDTMGKIPRKLKTISLWFEMFVSKTIY